MSDMDYDYDELCAWLRANSSGAYRFSATGADAIDKLRAKVAVLRSDRDAALDLALTRLDRIAELEADRQTLQRDGRHPAPCARHCEAAALSAEISLRDNRIADLEAELRWIDCNDRLPRDGQTVAFIVEGLGASDYLDGRILGGIFRKHAYGHEFSVPGLSVKARAWKPIYKACAGFMAARKKKEETHDR